MALKDRREGAGGSGAAIDLAYVEDHGALSAVPVLSSVLSRQSPRRAIVHGLYARGGCHPRRLDILRRVGDGAEVATARLPAHADQRTPLVGVLRNERSPGRE